MSSKSTANDTWPACTSLSFLGTRCDKLVDWARVNFNDSIVGAGVSSRNEQIRHDVIFFLFFLCVFLIFCLFELNSINYYIFLCQDLLWSKWWASQKSDRWRLVFPFIESIGRPGLLFSQVLPIMLLGAWSEVWLLWLHYSSWCMLQWFSRFIHSCT